MRTSPSLSATFASLLAAALATGCTEPGPETLATTAERTDYRETGRHEETLHLARAIADRSDRARLERIGTTPEGRPLKMLVIGKALDARAARGGDADIVLVTAGIHPGEVAGKDAGLALMRDLVTDSQLATLTDALVLLFIPVFNPDGHERFSPWNRINQDGPVETGWRSNARNLNLNRDFTKADSDEMSAWLQVFREWRPHLVLDLHTTNGADFQYDITYVLEHDDFLAEPLRNWVQDVFHGSIFPALERRGHRLAPYIWLNDSEDPTQGFRHFIATPRFSSGYAAVRNRPALMLEMHALKPYRQRVEGSYNFLLETLRQLAAHPGELRRIVEGVEQDARASRGRFAPEANFPLDIALTGEPEDFPLATYAWEQREVPPIGEFIHYDRERPIELAVPHYRQTRISATTRPPLAYVVPPQWTEVIERLDQHGIRSLPLPSEAEVEVVSWRFANARWSATPYEGRQILTAFDSAPVRERRRLAEGSRVVSMKQAEAGLIMHLLEPDAPDSLLRWGLFNSVFENKEYAEPAIMARRAARMLEEDAELRAEFERRMAQDAEFRRDPRRRIEFLYRHSPWFDDRKNVYPVVRVESGESRDLLFELIGKQREKK
jgi:hypothetical protein